MPLDKILSRIEELEGAVTDIAGADNSFSHRLNEAQHIYNIVSQAIKVGEDAANVVSAVSESLEEHQDVIEDATQVVEDVIDGTKEVANDIADGATKAANSVKKAGKDAIKHIKKIF